MRRRFLMLFLVLVAAVAAATVVVYAAGTVTMTGTSTRGDSRYVITWTSDAAGAVTGNAQTVKAGYLIQATLIPDSGGTQPTDLYDVTLVDESGLDLLAGQGANESNAAPHLLSFDPPIYNKDTLDLRITNAGNAKGGKLVLVVR